MDRHPQQIKRARQDAARYKINQRNMSKLRTLIKKVMESESTEQATPLYKDAVSFIDKMASINLIHKNTAGRRKASITRYLNSLS